MRLLRRQANYPYAVARVAAKRAKLIPPAEYEKILKMDVAEITRYIQDSAYKAEVDELASKFSGLDLLEAALGLNQERTYNQVQTMVSGPGGEILGLYLDRYHYEDLKTLLRGKTAGATREELLREMVLEDAQAYDLFAPLMADEVRTAADLLVALEAQGGVAREWGQVLARVPAGSPGSAYEDALDRAYYERLTAALAASREKGAPQVLDFVRREIDTRNLLNAARWVAAGEQGDFSAFVIPGGRILKVGDVVALSKAKDLAQFQEMLADGKTPETVRTELAAARVAGRLGPFQAALWRAHFAAMDKLAHSNPLSLVPILVFLVRKHREVAILRAVARGKAAGLSEARLRELVI